MAKTKKTRMELLEAIRWIKSGMCPNFYLKGVSASVLEKAGLELAGEIRKRNLISFNGMLEKFTILLPYFEDEEEAGRFLEHMENSVSIAQDCYDCFRGIILIEMDWKWGQKGFNESLQKVFEYIGCHKQICFIVLLPFENNMAAEKIYDELRLYGIWRRIEVLRTSPEQCLSSFEKKAEKNGCFLTKAAKKTLLEGLKKRAEDTIDNMEVLDNLLQQILFDRSMDSGDSNLIDIGDVTYMEKTVIRESDARIGFRTESGRGGEAICTKTD